MADLLSVTQRKVHLCRFPHVECKVDKYSRDAAYPPSSLRVEFDVSKGPSTGPEPSARIVLDGVLRSHPNVPCVPFRPPWMQLSVSVSVGILSTVVPLLSFVEHELVVSSDVVVKI